MKKEERWREFSRKNRKEKRTERKENQPVASFGRQPPSAHSAGTGPDSHTPFFGQLKTKESPSWKSFNLAGLSPKLPGSLGLACFQPTVWTGLSWAWGSWNKALNRVICPTAFCQVALLCKAHAHNTYPRSSATLQQ